MSPALQPPLSAPAKEFFAEDLHDIDGVTLNADNTNDFFDIESSDEGINSEENCERLELLRRKNGFYIPYTKRQDCYLV